MPAGTVHMVAYMERSYMAIVQHPEVVCVAQKASAIAPERLPAPKKYDSTLRIVI